LNDETTMNSNLVSALILTLPLLLGGTFHMWVVRRNWFAALARPISQAAFGANKSWRGVLVMTVATVPGVFATVWFAALLGAGVTRPLNAVSPLLLGIALGLGYALAELPNSFVKRRLGIAPGAPAARHRFWFTLIDQADSALGCALIYAWLIDVPVAVLLLIVLVGPAVHLAANLTLYSLGLRKEAL